MKDVVLRIREVILEADPRIEECIKWQAPTFTFEGNLASFFPKSKQHASLMFHQGALIPGSGSGSGTSAVRSGAGWIGSRRRRAAQTRASSQERYPCLVQAFTNLPRFGDGLIRLGLDCRAVVRRDTGEVQFGVTIAVQGEGIQGHRQALPDRGGGHEAPQEAVAVV